MKAGLQTDCVGTLVVMSIWILLFGMPLLWSEEIISDTFEGHKGLQAMPAKEMDTTIMPQGANLPDTTWQLASGGATDGRFTAGVLALHNGGGVCISLGNHNVNKLLTLSTTFCFNLERDPNVKPKEGLGILGFYPTPRKKRYEYVFKDFCGIVANLDGSLQLVVDGKPQGRPVPYNGKFDLSEFYTLRFTVDTVTGKILKITYGESKAVYDFSTTSFTNVATALAGIAGSVGNNPNTVDFRDFSATAEASTSPVITPEKTTSATTNATPASSNP
jgi:hypothetical protein